MILQVININVYYGQSHVLHEVCININECGTVCVLGRNGVGKTTLLRSIIGLKEIKTGNIKLDGEDITDKEVHQIARKGVGYVPQGREIFTDFTVEENLRLGMLVRRTGHKTIPEHVLEMFPILRDRLHLNAGNLSGGEKQMLAFARALVAEPRLLLLDEPTEGLAPIIVKEVREKIVESGKDRGVLLVEQNIATALATANFAYMIKKGTVVAEGMIDVLASDGIIEKHMAV